MRIGFKHQFYNPNFLDSLNLSINENFLLESKLFQNLSKNLPLYDFHSDLKNIKAPTLLTYGDYDPLSDLAGKMLHEAIPQSKFELIKNCGHFPFIEKEAEFNQIVSTFVAQNN
jgi:proline iminopeptidase